ncbi:MAG: hypothetical protein WDZ82_00665 [Candidatus Paceibacterota bacterium]
MSSDSTASEKPSTADQRKKEAIERICKDMKKTEVSFLRTVIWIYLVIALAGLLLPIVFTDVRWLIPGIIVVAIYTIFSFKKVRVDEIGTVLYFGAPIKHADTGIHFVPFGISSLETATQNYIQLEFGSVIKKDELGNPVSTSASENDEAFIVEDAFEVVWEPAATAKYPDGEEGKLLREEDAQSPYGARISTCPRVVVRWKIDGEPGAHALFLKMVGSVNKANRHQMQTAEPALQAIAGKTTLAQGTRRHHWINDQLTKAVEFLVGEPDAQPPENDVEAGSNASTKQKEWWGIDVEGVWVSDFGIPRVVNASVSEASSALAQKRTTITNAQAERERLELEGIGSAKVIESEGKARAEAEKALYKARALGVGQLAKKMKDDEGRLAYQLQQMERALQQGNNHLLMTGGTFDDLIKSVTSISKAHID